MRRAQRENSVELLRKPGDFVEQPIAVGDADVAPHLGVAGGDAREVAEAAGGEREQLGRVLALRDLVHQREREQVRQVADRGEHRVVLLGIHAADLRAAGRPETLYF